MTDSTAPRVATVWYRSSEGCPSGEQFLSTLETERHAVRLAGAGDRVDFIVTVATTSGVATGRLERQTNSGIIAISEIRDPDCAAVTNALALGLGLALASLRPSEPSAEPLADSPPEASPARDTSAAKTAPSDSPGSSSSASEKPPSAHSASQSFTHDRPAIDSSSVEMAWNVGLVAEGAFALTPHPLWGGHAFLERRATLHAVGAWALRFGPAAHHGREPGASGDVEQWLATARVDGCRLLSEGTFFVAAPCAGLDLGVASAMLDSTTGQRATTLWATIAAGGRVGVALAENFELQAQAAIRATLTPYRVRAGGENAYETRVLSPWAGLGLALGL